MPKRMIVMLMLFVLLVSVLVVSSFVAAANDVETVGETYSESVSLVEHDD